MKAALVLRGGPKFPDWAKLKKYGVTRLYWEAEDPQLDAGLLDAVRARPCDANPSVKYEVGVMRDPSWHTADSDPAEFAGMIDEDLVRLGSTAKQCAVMADIELHSASYVTAFLLSYRQLRPTRPLSWTLEPNQGGWFSLELVRQINADPNLIVSPQLYFGNMAPAVESLVALNIAATGVQESRIRCFYGLNNCLAAVTSRTTQRSVQTVSLSLSLPLPLPIPLRLVRLRVNDHPLAGGASCQPHDITSHRGPPDCLVTPNSSRYSRRIARNSNAASAHHAGHGPPMRAYRTPSSVSSRERATSAPSK